MLLGITAGACWRVTGKEPQPIPPGLLGLIHAVIGMPGQLDGVLAMVGKEGDADTGRDVQGQAGELKGLGQAETQFIGDPGRVIRIPDLVEEDDEFVPTDAAHRIRVAQAAG